MARDVAGCARMMEALAPVLAQEKLELEDVEVGFAWTELADPQVRVRVEGAVELFPRRRRLGLPLPEHFYDAFSREVADVHRELFAEHADSYGDNVRQKIERCLEVTDAEYTRAQEQRERYREQLAKAAAGVDLVLTPTLTCVAPRLGQDELSLRDTLTRLTYPFNTAGWPALALPCGAAEDGLPGSVQLAAAPGKDALVLAAGAALERTLSLD
jgi:Asp-tRNA(Asn)/Glu-tRNA(Gln) amidotransferase A subunit family amidase